MNNKKYKGLGTNALLNAIRNGLSIIFPLITYPYAFRVLHAEGIGKVNYAVSIVNYFLLFAALGISEYAVREGAKIREKHRQINIFAGQIFTIHLTMTLLSYSALSILLFCSANLRPYRGLVILSSLTIIFTTIGVEWINTIYEDYLYITVRSIAAQVITLILLFLMVRNEEDVCQYALLTVISGGGVALMNLFHCRKYIKLHLTRKLNLHIHMKPVLLLAANKVAVSIYVNSDVTMLGWYCGNYYIGIYEIAIKIYTVVKRIMAAVYTVFVPRFSYYVGQGDTDSIKRMYTRLVSTLTLVVVPASVGLIFISEKVILIMGGKEYIEAVPVLQILSVGLICAVFGGEITYCLNIPLSREKNNIKATSFSAAVNILLNIMLIPRFKQNGAAVTTVISEFCVFIYCICSFKDIKEYLDFKKWRTALAHAAVGCVTVATVTVCVCYVTNNTILHIILVLLFGMLLYFVELLLLNDENVLEFIKKLRRL